MFDIEKGLDRLAADLDSAAPPPRRPRAVARRAGVYDRLAELDRRPAIDFAAAVSVCAGTVVTIGLVVVAMWAWQHAAGLTEDAARPDVAAYAVRCAAVAAAAGAQVVLLLAVVGRIYRRGGVDGAVATVAVVVGTVSLVSAVALGLAGR
ncbi:MAG TPA: hypothetical protein VK324_06495 [Tepidisphaeraceae bacterium]|nr:hypothetical protein [Tepidisphaeraceae bacterium]